MNRALLMPRLISLLILVSVLAAIVIGPRSLRAEAGGERLAPGGAASVDDRVAPSRGYTLRIGSWSVRFAVSADLDLDDLADRLRGLLGMILILGAAAFLSSDRGRISRRVVVWGLLLQWFFAIVVLRWSTGVRLLRGAGAGVEAVLDCALDGARFVFGERLVDAEGPVGFVFAFRVLPTVVFVASLFAVLYHLGVMPIIVRWLAAAMARLLGISGAESTNVAASLFLGQTEAPLTIRPYLGSLTESELLTVMTAGMAHVSGGMMAAYFAYGVEPRHVLTAVVMTAPGSILLSKMLVPETAIPETLGTIRCGDDRTDAGLLDAAARGTREGLSLALNIAAILITFVGLVALLNLALGRLGTSLQGVFGWAMAPAAYMLGVPWEDCRGVGSLLGTRTVLNELIAFQQLDAMRGALMERSVVIAGFALCGFANIGSIGIQIGGIGALAPERRKDLARLGGRALLAGTLANFLSACIAGVLL